MTDQTLRELISENPMLIEITRFRRRYFSFSTGNSMNSVVLSMILIGYALMVLMVVENRESIPPISLVEVQTGLLVFFAPMMLYGSIAGERERRSWDLLLAAPITKTQIVMGKFMGALVALGIAVLAFQIPILIAALFCTEPSWTNQAGPVDISTSFGGSYMPMYRGAGAPFGQWMKLFNADLVSISFLVLVCALTILFSARVKRGLMALGAVLGILAVALIVLPSLATMGGVSTSDRGLLDVTLFFHPFHVISRLSEFRSGSIGSQALGSAALWGWTQSAIYLGMAAVFLTWASQTLNFAENEVKFLPQGEKNA